MSKLAELAYDIEQLYIEGHSPRAISALLECPLSTVYDWLESVYGTEHIEPEEYDEAFHPYNTINS